MPCHSTSTPAQACIVGGRLRNVKGSVCFNCYAYDRGNYRFGNVKASLQKRLDGITHPDWVDAMVTLIKQTGESFFRWHDSGDIQSSEHLANICKVATDTPNVQHWLPTKEYRIVADYRKDHTIPANLTIRLSAHMVDGAPPSGYGLPTSTVVRDAANKTCPAKEQGNQCLDCRACWSPNVANVAYPNH